MDSLGKVDLPGRDEKVHQGDVSPRYFSKSLFFIHARRHRYKSELFNCEESILERYFCGTCQTDFDTIILLKQHIVGEHFTEAREENSSVVYETKNYICQKCSFHTYSYLHWFKHASDDCCDPDKNVSSENSQLLLTDENKRFCKFSRRLRQHSDHRDCEQQFNSTVYRYYFKVHCYTQYTDGIGKQWYNCEKCTFKSANKNLLKTHSITQHAGDKKKWFGCEQCTYKTIRKRDLSRHFTAMHADNKDKKWFKCGQCTYKAIYKGSLKKHFNAMHTDNTDKKWFRCEQCTYKTIEKGHLLKHFEAMHVDDKDKKWFRCEQCTYKTIEKGHLARHFEAKHADKKWFGCEQCTYKTIRKRDLTRHFKAMHVDKDTKVAQV